MGRVGGDGVDYENILVIVEIGRFLFRDGCGGLDKDFNLGEEVFLASIKTGEEEKSK